MAARLRDLHLDGAFSSPYKRAVETIRPYCDSAGLDIQTDPDLAERQLKSFDLWLPFDELMHHLRLSFENWDYKMKGGESLNDTQRRALRGLRKSREAILNARLLPHTAILSPRSWAP
jgi:2,3-bisphosphoglycerate-dependent phosphoglycerate mutase